VWGLVGSPGYDPSTLQLPPPAVFSQLSDFAQQFWRIKARAMDLVLFVKHGRWVVVQMSADSAVVVPPAGCYCSDLAIWQMFQVVACLIVRAAQPSLSSITTTVHRID
jgi:hypothetical protein